VKNRCGRCGENPVAVEVLGDPKSSLCEECIKAESSGKDSVKE